MVDKKIIKMQLAAVDADLPFWVNAEVKQLTKIIVPGETIMHVASGRYEGGFALLCATSLRLLIVDKKPMFLTVEDVRYDMIAEVNFSHQLLDSSIHLSTVSKELWFTSFNKNHLRALTDYIQHKLSELRQGQPQGSTLMSSVVASRQVQDQMSSEQARELLPNTQQAWDRIGNKLDRINNPTFMRRRVAKFDTFH